LLDLYSLPFCHLFETLLAFHSEGFERINTIIHSYAVSIPSAAYALFSMFTVSTSSFEHFIDVSDICEKIGIINLPKAHFIYIIGIFPVNS
jgi:hypothetical protein